MMRMEPQKNEKKTNVKQMLNTARCFVAPWSLRGGDASDECVLALYIALTRRHPPDHTSFGPYVHSLPKSPPDSPIFWPDEEVETLLTCRAMPLSLVDKVDLARQEMDLQLDVAAAVCDRVVGADGVAEAPLTIEQYAWAWTMVRSRAINFTTRRGASGEVESMRCMVPVVDLMNHECAAPPRGPGDDAHRGPATQIEAMEGGGARWVTTRAVPAGAGITWTYGGTAYSNSVNFTDGTSVIYRRRERPHLIFGDPAQPYRPTHLVSSVQYEPGWFAGPTKWLGDASFTLVQPIAG